jgi:tetratricopeptide (TPR) repeat protein
VSVHEPFCRVLILAAGVALCPSLARAQVPRPPDPAAVPQSVEPAVEAVRPRQVSSERSEQEPVRDNRFEVFQRQLAQALARRDNAEALAIAERQYVLFPEEMKASADLGRLYFTQGQHEKAEPLLRAALSQQSAVFAGDTASVRGEVSLQLGQITLDSGRPKEAIGFLERSIDGQPMLGLPRFLLAIALLRTGNEERAERENALAFQIDSEGARAPNYALLARTQRAAGSVDEAAGVVEAGLRRFPSALDLRLELALTRRAQNRPAEALYELLYARALRSPNVPSNADFDGQIRALRREANVAEADPELKAVVTYLDAAESDNAETALAAVQDAVRLNGRRSFPLLLLLAQAYMASGRYSQAEQLLGQLVSRQPASLPALTLLADLYVAQGRFAGADQVIGRALRVDGSNPRLRAVIARRGTD